MSGVVLHTYIQYFAYLLPHTSLFVSWSRITNPESRCESLELLIYSDHPLATGFDIQLRLEANTKLILNLSD